MEKTNPRLNALIMEAVENQIRESNPPETKETLHRLMAEGISEENAKMYIAQAICVEIWHAGRGNEYNAERFVRNLQNLPAKPTE